MTRACCAMAAGGGGRYCGACGRDLRSARRPWWRIYGDVALFAMLGAVSVAATLAVAGDGFGAWPVVGRTIALDGALPEGGLSLEVPSGSRVVSAPAASELAEDAPPAASSDGADGGGDEGVGASGGANRRIGELLSEWRRAASARSSSGSDVPAASGAKGEPGEGSGMILPVSRVSASSFSPSVRTSYRPSNVVDGDRSTAWQVSRGGVGEWIRLDFPGPVTLERFGMVPGYDKVVADDFGDRWPLNNRVASVRLEWEGGSRTHRCTDDRAMQWIDLDGVVTSYVLVTVEEVFPGARWNDTAISEIRCEGALSPLP